MSLFGTSVFGVDVSDGTLKAVQVVKRGRRLRLVRSWRFPYHRQDDRAQAERDALQRWMAAAHPDVLSRVVISAPGQGHFSRTYVVPTMEAGRLAEMVRYEVLNELNVPEEDALVRFHVRKGVVENQVHAISLDPGRVADFAADLGAGHIPFDELQPAGFALASFVEHERPSGRDRILLGVGERATELVLMREDGLWTRHIPLGLSDVPDMRRLAERLADEVDAAVAFLLPQDIEFRPTEVVLTEEGALSAGLTTELRRALQRPVTRFAELVRLDTAPRLERGTTSVAQTLSMGKAIGLALCGLGKARFPCPVLPGNPRRAAARSLPLAAASLVLASLGLFAMTHLAVQRADRLAAAMPQDLAGEMRNLVQRSQQARSELSALQARTDGLGALVRRRPAVLAVRPALARLAELIATRGSESLHLDSAWLSPGEANRAGLLSLTVDADPSRNETLGDALQLALSEGFGEVSVSGPQPAPDARLSRWTVEINLP